MITILHIHLRYKYLWFVSLFSFLFRVFTFTLIDCIFLYFNRRNGRVMSSNCLIAVLYKSVYQTTVTPKMIDGYIAQANDTAVSIK